MFLLILISRNFKELNYFHLFNSLSLQININNAAFVFM